MYTDIAGPLLGLELNPIWPLKPNNQIFRNVFLQVALVKQTPSIKKDDGEKKHLV